MTPDVSGLRMTVLLVFFACTSVASAREVPLGTWFDDELTPALSELLTTHPRFRDQTLLFAVLDDHRPAAISNALAIDLRDRLLDSATEIPGLRIAWQQRPGGATTCSANNPDYIVGVELDRRVDSRFRVRVRLLDVREQQFVSGFKQTWHGRLGPQEIKAFRRTTSDVAFLGTREVPYRSNQVDLIAKHLSAKLHCEISRSLNDQFVVRIGTDDDSPLPGVTALAARNLDALDSLALTADVSRATAALKGTAHAVDGSLHQYWLNVIALDTAEKPGSVSTSLYVDLAAEPSSPPALDAAARSHNSGGQQQVRSDLPGIAGVEMPGADVRRFLAPLAVHDAGLDSYCRRNQACAVLKTEARRDAIVFTLVHNAGAGLSRAVGDSCHRQSGQRVVAAGHSALFVVPDTLLQRQTTHRVSRWRIAPETDVYYAIAVDNARDARQLATLIDRLPASCGGSVPAGLQHDELRRWLEQLSHIMLQLGDRAGWRGIAVNASTGRHT